MRQNIVSALLQSGLSLLIAALSISIFRFLAPEQVAFIRQHYFVPFAIVTALAPANQNYLRSILFSDAPPDQIRSEASSLILVQIVSGLLFLAVVLVALQAAGTDITLINAVTLLVALALVLQRTVVTGAIEFKGHYSTSIVINNAGIVIPYIAVFGAVLAGGLGAFFTGTTLLNLVNIAILVVLGFYAASGFTRSLLQFPPQPFAFNFRRYVSLSVIAVGSVIVYQGVEFALYNFTTYDHVDVANYALAFSASVVLRQVIITAVQPLEHERHYNGRLRLGPLGEISRPIVVEFLIYVGLTIGVLILPPIFTRVFPGYESAGHFVAPLLFGVLGSAIQGLYAVRMIAQARTLFLSVSQLILAFSCVAVTVILSPHISLIELIWVTSFLTWFRGCIVIPVYAEQHGAHLWKPMWIVRTVLSAVLLSFAF